MKTKHIAVAVAALAISGAALAQTKMPAGGEQGKASTPAATPTNDDAYWGRTWSSMDANSDGRVSRDEYLKYYGGRWDTYDAKKSGYLSRDEARRLWQEREMSKTDGHPMGTPLNPTTKKP